MVPAFDTRRCVVTGMGAVCAVAHDCGQLEHALDRGLCGIGPITRFDTSPFQVATGAEVKNWPDGDGSNSAQLCLGFAEKAAHEALQHAGVRRSAIPAERVGLVFGTNLGDLDGPVHALATELASALDIRGPCLTICTACSSSTGAIGFGRELLAMGSADLVLAGGADVLTPTVFAGFHALGVLSPGKCAPFSVPFGTSLGEGAGFMVLESEDRAQARGAAPVATLAGFGLSGDAFHETSPEPRGLGVERAVSAAVADAGIELPAIGYVNAHGSGTQANDASEWRGIRRALGSSAGVPVSSSKGALGHAQGAAGVLEAILTVLAMRRDLIPPTLNFVEARHFAPEDPVPGPLPRSGPVRHAVCVNSAFGGANAALVFSRGGAGDAGRRHRGRVIIRGAGMIGPRGTDVDALTTLEPGKASGRVPSFSLRDIDRRIDPNGLDPSALFLTAAAALALSDAGVGPTAAERAQTGLIVGALRASPESVAAFERSVETRGLGSVSAPAFARIVLNAAAGSCSKLLGLKGPLSALTVGAGTGLAAVLFASELLGTRVGHALMLAGAVDELASDENETDVPAGEGAVCVALGVAGADENGAHRAPGIAGYAVAGPGAISIAVERALGHARVPDVDRVFDERDFAGGGTVDWALPSALAFVAAASAIRRGRIGSALVTSGSGPSMSLAMVLTA